MTDRKWMFPTARIPECDADLRGIGYVINGGESISLDETSVTLICWCGGPVPVARLRKNSPYCNSRCRQRAASHRMAVRDAADPEREQAREKRKALPPVFSQADILRASLGADLSRAEFTAKFNRRWGDRYKL